MMRDELLAALRDPRCYRIPPVEVTHISTHISDLFFAGERVYKVKKPVNFGFLDFSTLERRRTYCEEEVRLNRRLAPRVYLRVVPIVANGDGAVSVGGNGDPLEFAVEMRRLPATRMFDHLLDEGVIDNAQLDDLAHLLVDFHRSAATGPGVDEHGTLAAVTRNALENFDETREFVGRGGRLPKGTPTIFDPDVHEYLREKTVTFLRDHAETFGDRVRSGWIRDGHGDLHAGNICFAAGGIVAYDCIEFSSRFRCGDVAADLAFLAMDLDLRRLRGFSDYLVYRYVQLSHDTGLSELNVFYKSYRAMVRAKVAAFRLKGCADEAGREEASREALRYFHLAASYWLPPALVMTCGLPASGKSHAARAIGQAFEAVVLRTDVIRQRSRVAATHSGIEPDVTPGDAYSPDAKAKVYQTMFEQARSARDHGRWIVLDATFGRRADRDRAAQLAQELGLRLVVVEAKASRTTIEARMKLRSEDRGEASEADLEVHDRLAESFEPPDEVPPARRVVADEGAAPEDIVGRVVAASLGA